MKAAVYERYGPPQVLRTKDVADPSPGKRDVLVKVHATTVNFGDLFARNLKNKTLKDFYMPSLLFPIVKLSFGIGKPKVKVLGSEFSGVVESTGKDVARFKVGDEVFGYTGQSMGAYAEYLTINEKKMIGLKPNNMSHEEATCLPYGMIMSYDHLGRVDIKPIMKLLVNGASGGIGSIGLQIAKSRGAEVTGVCGSGMAGYVKGLGADHVIDYRKEDFTKNGEKYDVIYDILGKRSFKEVKGSLTENGTYLNASFKGRKVIQSIFKGKKMICAFAGEDPSRMPEFRRMMEEGKIKPIIDRTFTIEEADKAHSYVESGKRKGNVVLKI